MTGCGRLSWRARLRKLPLGNMGLPCPGRRYSIQASALNAPAIVVGGLVEDGPIPMGPIVYVESTTNAISTIHCRCTAAQVRIVSETRVYALRPMEDALESGSWDGGTKETGQDRRWFSTIPRKQGRRAYACLSFFERAKKPVTASPGNRLHRYDSVVPNSTDCTAVEGLNPTEEIAASCFAPPRSWPPPCWQARPRPPPQTASNKANCFGQRMYR